MNCLADHLIVAPVLLPLLAAAMMLGFGEGRRNLNAGINVASTFALAGIAVALLRASDAAPNGVMEYTASATGRRRLRLYSSSTGSPPSCCC